MTGRTASTHDDGATEVGPAGTAKGNGSNRHPGALQSTQVKTASTKGREATKENVKPVEGDGARRRRKLPSPGGVGGFGGGGKLRRAQSLSFLPSVGDPNNGERTRRRLPDPGQGRLIQEVADKLEEEAQVRLEVARELKEEKRKRWKLEDQVTELQKECGKVQLQLDEKKRACDKAKCEAEDERVLRHDAEYNLEAFEKELRRSKLELQRLRATQDSAADDAVYGEQALKDAWEATFTEKKMRQEAQEQLEALKRGILSSGGAEVLQQLLRVGEASMGPGGDELPMSPTMHVISPTPETAMMSPGMKYESNL